MTILPNLYKTNLDHPASSPLHHQPVMVTLNPYSSQLVDNLNRMMKEEEEAAAGGGDAAAAACNLATLNPQLARLTATLRKKRCELGHPGPCRQTCGLNESTALQMSDRAVGGSGRLVNPNDVVFRAVSPHGHVYWEINPKEGNGQPAAATHQSAAGGGGAIMVGSGKSVKSHQSASSTGDENTASSDLQNISDFSDSDDHRATSEMSRQSSSRFSESRPLIYTTTSSASTSPGHSNGSHAAIDAAAAVNHFSAASRATAARFGRGVTTTAGGGRWQTTLPPNFHEEVYAYAATDFVNHHHGGGGGGGNGSMAAVTVPEQLQSQVQIKDLRTLPVSVKSKEYIMAKIADYTERNANQV